MKLEELDGTYSTVATAIAGSSVAVLSVRGGMLEGWDISGTRYRGTVTVGDDGSLAFDVEAVMPPNTFMIWGTSDSETFQTRQIRHNVPAGEFVEGHTITLKSEEMTIVFKRVPDEQFAALAGEGGLDELITRLQRSQAAWHERLHGEAPPA